MSDSIKKLTNLFAKFPTIGQRTAGRFVFYLLSLPKEKIDELIYAINEIKSNVTLCSFCFNPHETPVVEQSSLRGKTEQNLCPICQNLLRDKKTVCVVEKEADLASIENTKRYHGLYFILGGNVLSLKKSAENLRINELKERIENPNKFGLANANFSEIIIATNPTPEGKATSMLIEKTLKDLAGQMKSSQSPFKITHLAKGLPVGGELEYADPETLESAFEGRK